MNLKLLLQQFYKEALLWTHFSHPNILPFYGVNATLFPGKLCLVSPWMVNGDLVKFLKSNPSHDKLKATIDIASGIMYLHSQNIVHGDIKGANVVVDEQGQCYLTDFGLAIACMTTTLLSRATTYTGKGTIRWMAPELLGLSDEEDDESLEPDNTPKLSSDTYAYACTIYEIVAGTIPFANLKDGKVVLKVVNGKRPPRPQAVSWCPDSIWGVVEQCWKQESHLRPTAADVHAFLTHLERRRKEGLPWEEEVFNHVQEDN
ncbi:kinase-like protein [Marasmius fiardii PR-910]|nr:kinase-like protein [Marasmius fiardii PR-910]